MPINLEAIQNGSHLAQFVNNEKVTPKLFDKLLTGTGLATRGYFNVDHATVKQLVDYQTPNKELADMLPDSELTFTSTLVSLFTGNQSASLGLALAHEIEAKSLRFLQLMTYELDAVLATGSGHAHIPTKWATPLFFLDVLDTDLRKLEEQRLQRARGEKIKKADVHDPRWIALDNANYPFDAYVHLELEGLLKVTNTTTKTNDTGEQVAHVQDGFSYSGYANLVIVPKGYVPNDQQVLTGKFANLNKLLRKDQATLDETTADLENVLNGDSFFLTRVPLKGLFSSNAHLIESVFVTLADLINNIIGTAHVNGTNFVSNIVDTIADMNIATTLTAHAERIKNSQIAMFDDTLEMFDSVAPNLDDELRFDALVNLVTIFTSFEKYNTEWVTTTDFNRIYNSLQQRKSLYSLNNVRMSRLTSSHLRLMMSQSLFALNDLNENGQLYKFTPKDTAVTQKVQTAVNYSDQQKEIILTEEPLVVVTAGAGSGKSYTTVGRLHYLAQQGEDMSKVMVLSFTNVAADNITNRYSEIKSLTLGDLFNRIYNTSFPAQELSYSTTFTNSLMLLDLDSPYFAQKTSHVESLKETAREFIQIMKGLDTSGFKRIDVASVIAKLSRFITANLDDVIILMDAVGQTTLDLQPIIIHNLLMTNSSRLTIPEEFTELNHILTDESQDISTFEYVLLLNMSARLRANMMITGDGGQTLFEFRNSNPRFLNAIETSGVFKPYRLTTNYRSKQSILTYANQFLNVITANEYAKIQLKSNELSIVDEASLNEAVTIVNNYPSSFKKGYYIDSLNSTILQNPKVMDWLRERLINREQVAIMASTHAELDGMIDAVNWLMQSLKLPYGVTKINPTRQREKSHLSRAIREYSEALASIPLDANHADNYRQIIENSCTERFKDQSKAFVPNYVSRILDNMFGQSSNYHLFVANVLNNTMPREQLDGFMKQFLINAEIHQNRLTKIINRPSEQNTDYSQVPVVATTIHSAKGLEFEHTLIAYNEQNKNATSQATLRLYGVALTRAKESELIINSVKPEGRIVTSSLEGMFKTPMSTAQLRCLNDIKGVANERRDIIQVDIDEILYTDDDVELEDQDLMDDTDITPTAPTAPMPSIPMPSFG